MTASFEQARAIGPTDAVQLVEPSTAELRERYRAYRRRQARRLIALIPREGVRPLLRSAARDRATSEPDADPMARLLDFCETLIPLPPFHVWVEDFLRNTGAHLLDLQDAADAPTAVAPETLEARRLESLGQGWIARLRGYRDPEAWRGFISFESASSAAVHSTAVIFREHDARALRERFLSFEAPTLEAFLRSSLP